MINLMKNSGCRVLGLTRLTHNYLYKITPDISLSVIAFYFMDIDEKDRYRYGLNLNLMVGLVNMRIWWLDIIINTIESLFGLD